jgi:LmbE family N-acetylglucosaminyl deacetylase
VLLVGGATRAAAIGPCSGGDLYVAAHQDDTLLFQSPSLLADVQAGHCVQTIFLTAGDSGRPASYWEGRETGAEVAYEQMAGVSGASWSVKTETVNGHPIDFATLPGKPISIAYLRLPDGGIEGEGFPLYGGQSLMKLWDSGNPPGEGETPITSIEAVDDSTSYSYEGLVATVRSLIESFAPQEIATQNYTVKAQGPDHADHVSTAKFVKAAQSTYALPHLLVPFEDYETSFKAENVAGAALAAKSSAFYAYGAHDDEACTSEVACAMTSYAKWLKRHYTVVGANESTPGAAAGSPQVVLTGSLVKLDGSGSFDPGGGSLQYEWTQTAGPSVTLSDPTAQKPSFTAPGTAAALTFSLTVDNGTRESLPSSVTITVGDAPAFVSSRSAGFTVGIAGTFAIATTGAPPATVTQTAGALPAGLRFTAGPNGTATISGTPAASAAEPGKSRSYALTVKAANVIGDASQSLTLTVTNSRTVVPKPPAKVKLSKRKVQLVVGKKSKRVVEVTAPSDSRISCRGELPKGARCRVTAQRKVVVEGSKSVKKAGTFHLTVRVAGDGETAKRGLIVVFKRQKRR